MTNQTFVYSPKSHNPVFAMTPGPAKLTVVQWDNQSHHIVGEHVVLRFPAANPKQWWRNDARVFLTKIASAIGGVAWDDHGVMNIAVAPENGPVVAEKIITALRAKGMPHYEVAEQLAVMANCSYNYKLEPIFGGSAVTFFGDYRRMISSDPAYMNERGKMVRRWTVGEYVLVAPEEWNIDKIENGFMRHLPLPEPVSEGNRVEFMLIERYSAEEDDDLT